MVSRRRRAPAPGRRRPAGPAEAARRRRAVLDPVHGPVERGDVDAPAGVLAERGRRCDTASASARSERASASATERSCAAAQVAVDVAAGERGQAGVAHDVAAGDRAHLARRARARTRGRRSPGGVAHSRRGGGVRARALPARPAVVDAAWPPSVAAGATSTSSRALLADVADHQVVRLAVEGEAPRVAQADARTSPASPPASGSMRSIFPSRAAGFCALWSGVVAAAAVAGADPQPAVGPELQLAAVVVPVVAGGRRPARSARWRGRRGRRPPRRYSRTWICPAGCGWCR